MNSAAPGIGCPSRTSTPSMSISPDLISRCLVTAALSHRYPPTALGTAAPLPPVAWRPACARTEAGRAHRRAPAAEDTEHRLPARVIVTCAFPLGDRRRLE